MSLENFRSSAHVSNYPKGQTNILGVGTFDLKVSDVYLTNDHKKSLKNPVDKEVLPEWKDATQQMAVVFWHKEGVTVRRFNANGFVRYSELEEGQRKDFDELGTEGYAVHKKSKTRVIDEVRTASAINIINQFFDACGLAEGSSYLDLPGCMVSGSITAKEYGDKTFYELSSFKAVKSVEQVAQVEAEY